MAGEDARYEQWIRTQPCARCGTTFRIEVHHALWGTTYSPEGPVPRKSIEGARKGKGQKSHSHFSTPLCIKCHVPGIHRGGGSFSGTTPEEREAWERQQIAIHRNRYAMQSPQRLPETLSDGARLPEIRASKRCRGVGAGWSVAGIRDWCRKEAPTRVGPAADALTELANLIEEDTR